MMALGVDPTGWLNEESSVSAIILQAVVQKAEGLRFEQDQQHARLIATEVGKLFS